jgi:hypothetical protein
VRWDNLFNDLSVQLENELDAEDTDLRAEEERLRLGRLILRDRLSSLARADDLGVRGVLHLRLVSGQTVTVRPQTFGRDWLAGELAGELVGDLVGDLADNLARAHAPGSAASMARLAACVIPLAAIASVTLQPAQVQETLTSEPESSARLTDRIGLSFVLRDLCRRRQQVELHTAQGLVTGTIDRVGQDHFDLAVHERGTVRRAGEVRELRLLPFAQVHLVRFG